MRHLVLGVPGLAPLIAEEVGGDLSGNDGRADVVVVDKPGRRFDTRLGEDVIVELATSATRRPLRSVVAEIVPALSASPMEKALSVWAAWRQPLSSRMTYRVVARVLSEDAFLRSELRDILTAEVGRARPAWRVEDPADIELWALEDRPGRLRVGLRLTTGEMRQRGGRTEEREAALRPSVAAALVHLAGEPRGTLVDPCCGSGTVLIEAMAARWQPSGGDIDLAALDSAGANLRSRQRLWQGDARNLPFADGAIGAVATNLPFGHQCKLPSQPRPWLAAVLSEAARVTDGGPVVVLCPQSRDLDAAVTASALGVRRSLDIRLLGRRTTLFCLAAT